MVVRARGLWAARATVQRSSAAPLGAAIAFSALVHACLLFGTAPRSAPATLRVDSVLHARLAPAVTLSPVTAPPAEAVSPPAKAHAATAAPSRDDAQPAFEQPSAGAAQALQDPPPPLAVPVIVDATFYPPRELDVLPTLVVAVNPTFPRRARDEQVSGAVTLELFIDETGVVREVTTLAANPEGYFEQAAVESFKAAHFTPAQRAGVAVRSKLAIQVDFTLDPGANSSMTQASR